MDRPVYIGVRAARRWEWVAFSDQYNGTVSCPVGSCPLDWVNVRTAIRRCTILACKFADVTAGLIRIMDNSCRETIANVARECVIVEHTYAKRMASLRTTDHALAG